MYIIPCPVELFFPQQVLTPGRKLELDFHSAASNNEKAEIQSTSKEDS